MNGHEAIDHRPGAALPPPVLDAELSHLVDRRRLVFPEADPNDDHPNRSPADSTHGTTSPVAGDGRREALADVYRKTHELRPFGLALSGGGIRSATFNLGVLQGLAERGLLPYVDYLSTVSGGGYIGTWLHGLIRHRCGGDPRAAARILSPTANPIPASPDVDPVSFLRKYSNYLAPRPGLFSADSWVIGLIWLRNVLLNQLILVPTVTAGVLVLLFGGFVQQMLAAVRIGMVATAGLGVAAVILALAAFAVTAVIAARNLRAVVRQSALDDTGSSPPRISGAKGETDKAKEKKAERSSLLIVPLVFVGAILIGCSDFSTWKWHGLAMAAGTVAVGLLLAVLQVRGGFVESFGARHLNLWRWARPVAFLHVAWMVLVSAMVTIALILATARLLSPAGAGRRCSRG